MCTCMSRGHVFLCLFTWKVNFKEPGTYFVHKFISSRSSCLITVRGVDEYADVFYIANDTGKRQPTEWEKIFANHTYERGLLSRIFKAPRN